MHDADVTTYRAGEILLQFPYNHHSELDVTKISQFELSAETEIVEKDASSAVKIEKRFPTTNLIVSLQSKSQQKA